MQKLNRVYGPSGDNSLEYIGLAIQDSLFRSIKKYRRLSKECNEYEIVEKYKNHDFFSKIIRYGKIYDFSSRKNSEGDEFLRFVFEPFKKVLADRRKSDCLFQICHLEKYRDFFTQLIRYYQKIQFTGSSPLLKMGVELDSNGEVKEAKAYFALKSYDNKSDTLGKWHRYADCKNIIDESLRLLGMQSLNGQFLKIAIEMEKIYFFPVFLGVNFSENYMELKVYYQTCFPDYSGEYILKAEDKLAGLLFCDPEEFRILNAGCLKDNLFIDGVSYSVIKNKNGELSTAVWKPYYTVYTGKLIRTRKMDYYNFEQENIHDLDFCKYKEVLLVNNDDQPVGMMNENPAHKNGCRHRAFSIYLCDENGNIIMKRTTDGQESRFTCICHGHPFTEYLKEEAESCFSAEYDRFSVELKEISVAAYIEKDQNGIMENEIDHILIGKFNGKVDEVQSSEMISIPVPVLLKSLQNEPEKYTLRFQKEIKKVIGYLMGDIKNGR